MFHNLPNAVFFKDSAHRFVQVNYQKAREQQVTPEDMIGKTDFDFYSQEIAQRCNADDLYVIRTGKSIIQKEEVTGTFNGSKRWVLITKLPWRNMHNEIIGTMGIATNITYQKSIENKLLHLKEEAEEANRLKSAFLANMSHEIRTPLTGIIGFAQLLQEEDISGESLRRYTRIIYQNSEYLLHLITEIIDLSKIDSGQIKLYYSQVDLFEFLSSIRSVFLNHEKIKNSNDLQLMLEITEQGSHYLYIDETRLQQVLYNLLSNALKFTDTGSIRFGYSEEENMLTFYVKDTGIGIPKDEQKNIFERFRQVDNTETRNYGGTGLGLSICKEIVHLFGGEIYVESEVGEGSTFYFTVPYKSSP